MDNIWIVLGLTVFSIILGIIWYGPLFGKKFSWANDWPDFSKLSKEEQAEKQKQVTPYYLLQAVVTFLQIMVLGWFVEIVGKTDGIETALFLWLGFILPIMAGNAVWNMQPNNKRLTILAIGLSYQLVLMAVAGYVFSLT